MTKNQKIFASIDALVQAEGISEEFVIAGLEEAVAIACRKYYGIENVEVKFDTQSKRIKISGTKEIVDEKVLGEAFDPTLYIDIEEALKEKDNAKIGGTIKYRLKLEPELMDRSTIATAKQVFRQKLREAKYQKILQEYQDKVGSHVIGTFEDSKGKFTYFKLPGNIDAVLPENMRAYNDVYEPNKSMSLIIERIEPQSKKGPKVVVSRNSKKLVKYELEKLVPEVKEGLIKIESIARDAGRRSKIALSLNTDADIDIFGAIIGPQGSRINEIRRNLGGEHIDLIEYFEDPQFFISNALSPALVTAVQLLNQGENENDSTEIPESRVIVPDDQLSLAIGSGGQNVRLASQLTGWKIDILSESQAEEAGINYEEDTL